MLEKILSLPLDDNKYYALRAGHEPIVNGETNFEALVYSFEDRLVLFGFAYAPFYFEVGQRLHVYKDFDKYEMDFYSVHEITQEEALDCFRFFMVTNHDGQPVFLSPDIDKQFVIDSVLHIANSFGNLIKKTEKASIKKTIKAIVPVDDDRPCLYSASGFSKDDLLPEQLVDCTAMAYLFSGRQEHVHFINYFQHTDPNLSMIISKSSEAVAPNVDGNIVGDGASLDGIIQAQPGIRFIINAGFNHYRKDFYNWKDQNFNVGDPVGIVKIRDNLFEDYLDIKHYGFLVQETKWDQWKIVDFEHLDKDSKYILGCTPFLIHNSQAMIIPTEEMIPVKEGEINPPSFLGHGMQIHPRTAVATVGREIVFIIVENNPDGTGGCTLEELQRLGMSMGFESMLNLDGGGSSQFRLMTDEGHVFSNYVLPEDASRVLGHSIIIFDESLK